MRARGRSAIAGGHDHRRRLGQLAAVAGSEGVDQPALEERVRLGGHGRLEQVVADVVDAFAGEIGGMAQLAVCPKPRPRSRQNRGGQLSRHCLVIPADLLPGDGRFGSGPAKTVRPRVLERWPATGHGLLGTSHRRRRSRRLVGEVKVGLSSCSRLPEGYEVVLGNGGSTLFWDVAVASLIGRRSAHASFGEFSAKFAAAAAAAPAPGRPPRW